MPSIYTDFSEYVSNQTPPDWEIIWTTADTTWAVRDSIGATGGKELERTGANIISSGYVWKRVNAPSNTEVLTRFKISSVSAQVDILATRTSGNTFPTSNCYLGIWLGGTLYLGVRNSETLTVLGSTAFSMSAETYYWARLRSEGTTHSLSVWLDGSPEPATFMLTATDASHASGEAGVLTRQDYTYTYDVVSISVDGEIAPPEPIDQSLKAKLMITR